MNQKSADIVPTALGVQEIELSLIRELAAYHDWDLRTAAMELDFMRRVCGKVAWREDYVPLIGNLLEAVKNTARTVAVKDTTLITSAHTQLEQAVFALRDRLYA